jgi:hypothetical protein
MKKNLKIMAFMVVITLVLTLPLSAQWARPTSNQKQATANVFGTDVDNYMDVNYFGGVGFDKWFGYIGYNTTDNLLNLGYATKLKGIYLGTWYEGNVVSFTGTPRKSVQVTYPATTTGFNPTEVLTTTSWNNARVTSNNELHALIGLGNMGIRVGFWEGLTTNMYDKSPNVNLVKTENKTTGITSYTGETVNYSYLNGTMAPSVLWGMNMNVNAMTIRPYAGVYFRIFQDKQVDITRDGRTDSAGTTPVVTDVTETYRTYTNAGYLYPTVRVGTWVDMPKESYNLKIGLGYNLSTRLYSNDYDVPGASGTANGTVSILATDPNAHQVTKDMEKTTTQDNSTLIITERTYWNHNINPTVKVTKDISGLKLGFSAGVPVRITTETSNASRDEYSVTKVRANSEADKYLINSTITDHLHATGDFSETTTFNIAPVLAIGASYELIAKRFTVNAGVSATPLNYTNTTTKTKPGNAPQDTKRYYKEVDGYGVTTVDYVTSTVRTTRRNEVEVSDTWGALTADASAGFVFNFNENFAVDLFANTVTNFRINVTTLGVLFTFKF